MKNRSTRDDKIDLGLEIIDLLSLKVIRSGPDKGRVRTTGGTKTPLGLYLTLKRITDWQPIA